MRNICIKRVTLSLGLLFCVACQPSVQVVITPTVTSQIPTKSATLNQGTDISEPIITTTPLIEDIVEGINTDENVLRLWHPFSGREAEMMESLVDQYNQQQKGDIEIISASHSDDQILIDDIEDSIENGELPEIIIAPSSFLKVLAVESRLEQMESQSPDLDSLNTNPSVFPEFWNLDLVGDTRYGIPFIQKGYFLFYQDGWAEDLGFSEFPATIEDFSQQVCAAYSQNLFDTDLENNGSGGYFFPDDPVSIIAWMSAFDGGISFNSRGEIILNTEQNLQALTFLFNMYEDGCAWWTAKEQFPYRYFSNRNAIIFSGRSDEVPVQQNAMEEDAITDEWELIPYPSVDGKPIIYYENYSFAITKRDKSAIELAIPFIEWMIEPDQHLQMVYINSSFPLSNAEVQKADQEWEMFPYWKKMIQFIPFLEPVPQNENWLIAEKVIDDLGWQIIQFAVQEGDIATYLVEAEKLVNELIFGE